MTILGSSDPKQESPVSYGYSSRQQSGFEGRYSHYSRYKDPDTISQTSFRSINEVDYGRIQDTQENERLLFQVSIFLIIYSYSYSFIPKYIFMLHTH